MSMTIGIVFDFDDTLAPDSTSDFLRTLGVDPPAFWSRTVQALLDDDWDPIPAYLHKMIELSQQRPAGERITIESLREFGATIQCFEGVEEVFDALSAEAKAIDPEVNVEFYLISSGIGEILRASPIASRFRDIWACDFHYNDASEIVFPRTS